MIKRIGLLIVAALVAAMMMVATAAPAFASAREGETDNQCKGGNPNCTEVTLNGSGKKAATAKGECGGCITDDKFKETGKR